MDERLIDVKQNLSKFGKKYRPKNCVFCGKLAPRFCNSHSVPRFILKNISDKGMIYQATALINTGKVNLLDDKKGINNTGTFHNICMDCDNRLFSDYENPVNLFQKPNTKIMLEIAIKNTLYSISKKYLEKGLCEYTKQEFGKIQPLEEYYSHDMNDLSKRFIRYKKALANKKKIEFELLFWEKVDFVVPIACQEEIVLIGDLNGYRINDIFNKSLRKTMQCINVCVYPFKNSSIIMLFRDRSYTNYNNFAKQFSEITYETQLEIINYIILSLTEDYYIFPKIRDEVFANNNLKEISSDLHLAHADFLGNIYPKDIEKLYSLLANRLSIPNLLTKEYAIR